MVTEWSSKAMTKVSHRFSIQKVPDNLGVVRVDGEIIGTLPLSALLLLCRWSFS